MRRTAEDKRAFVAARAEQMKAAPTEAEARMWEILERLGFVRQWPIHGQTKNGLTWHYIADFYCAPTWGTKIVVEVDGGIHRKQKGRDRRRAVRMATEGICTIRFSNSEVMKDAALCGRIVEEDMRLIAKGLKVNRT